MHADDAFVIIATMNPGGDFGKRELSPALRNRFTEIWVEPLTNKSFLVSEEGAKDVVEMISTFLTIKRVFSEEIRTLVAHKLLEFLRFFNVKFCEKHQLDKKNLTMRDIVALMEFISKCQHTAAVAYIYAHALRMVVVEPIGFMQIAQQEKQKMKEEIEAFIVVQTSTIQE